MSTQDQVIYPSRTPSTRKVGRHEIRNTLHQRIISGEWRPGAKLRQQQLAKDFGVSMGMVREALLELQAWGLVETHDNRGIFVRVWDAEKLHEAYEMREVIEGLGARRCCGRITEAQLQELEALAETIFELASGGKVVESSAKDRDFHYRLIEIGQSSMVKRLADNYRFLGKVVGFRSDPAKTRWSHLEILQAIRANLPEESERLARAHVASGRRSLERQIADGTFEPNWIL